MHYNFGMFHCVGGCARSCVCVCCGARAKPICTPPQCLSALLLNMRAEWILSGVLHHPPKQQVRFNGVRALHSAHDRSIMRLMLVAVAAIPRGRGVRSQVSRRQNSIYVYNRFYLESCVSKVPPPRRSSGGGGRRTADGGGSRVHHCFVSSKILCTHAVVTRGEGELSMCQEHFNHQFKWIVKSSHAHRVHASDAKLFLHSKLIRSI